MAIGADQRQEIVREVVEDHISPADLARKYGVSAHSIREWIKKAGQSLPKNYKRSEWSLDKRPNAGYVSAAWPEAGF